MSQIGNIGRALFLATNVSVMAWAFTPSAAVKATPKDVDEITGGNIDNAGVAGSVDPSSQAELARWMQRTSQEGIGATLEAALSQVGPWAGNQTAADNEVRAAVPEEKNK